MDAKLMKTVYTVVERDKKSYWVRIGVGYINSDGSINLKLDATPVNGTIQVRDYEPKEAQNDRGARREEHRGALA